MKKLLYNLNHNGGYAILGLITTLTGIDLWSSPNYFFWPPQWAHVMNDDGIDAMAVLIGISLIVCSLGSAKGKSNLLSILIGLSCGFITLVTCVLLVHVCFAHLSRLTIPVIFGLGVVGLIFWIAKDHSNNY